MQISPPFPLPSLPAESSNPFEIPDPPFPAEELCTASRRDRHPRRKSGLAFLFLEIFRKIIFSFSFAPHKG